MKKIIVLLFLSMFMTMKSICQSIDPQTIVRWDSLKTQIQNRAHIAADYISYISGSKAINRKDVKKVNSVVRKLLRRLNSSAPIDSAFIGSVFTINADLNTALGQTLILLERDPQYRTLPDSRVLMAKFLDAEKAFQTQLNSYNNYILKQGLVQFAFGPIPKRQNNR